MRDEIDAGSPRAVQILIDGVSKRVNSMRFPPTHVKATFPTCPLIYYIVAVLVFKDTRVDTERVDQCTSWIVAAVLSLQFQS